MECNNCWAEYAYESRFSAASSKFSFNSGKERLNFSFLGGFTPGAWVELSSFLLLKIWNGYVYFDLFPSRIQVCHNFQNVVYIFNFLAENAQIQCMLNLINTDMFNNWVWCSNENGCNNDTQVFVDQRHWPVIQNMIHNGYNGWSLCCGVFIV